VHGYLSHMPSLLFAGTVPNIVMIRRARNPLASADLGDTGPWPRFALPFMAVECISCEELGPAGYRGHGYRRERCTHLGWRKGGAPDIAAIERADPSKYDLLVEPELRKPSPLLAAPHGIAPDGHR
jgi:hypothetical protein